MGSRNGAIARRNLLCTVAADHVALSIWTLWPVMAVFMPAAVYGFSASDKLLPAVCTFGSWIGFSFTFGQMMHVNSLADGQSARQAALHAAQIAFLGPLLGSLARIYGRPARRPQRRRPRDARRPRRHDPGRGVAGHGQHLGRSPRRQPLD